MSTISVVLSGRLADAYQKAGQGYVSAPVCGRPEAAAAAKLFCHRWGCRHQMLTGRQPLFDAIGQATLLVGARPSEANLVKLAGNSKLR